MEKRIFYNFIIAIFLGLVANGIWLYELVVIIGWEGLKWLGHQHISIFIINAIVILAYLFPFWQNAALQEKNGSKSIAFISLYCCTLMGYYAVKTIIFGYGFLIGLSVTRPIALTIILSLPFLIYWISYQFIFKIKKRFIFLLITGFVLTLIASTYTLDVIPGFGHSYDIIDAIKMGYPYFWITVIMNLIGLFTEQKLLVRDDEKWLVDCDDILDA